MEYTTDWILKSPIEDIQEYLKNATIIDLIAVIENIKKRVDLDYLSLIKVKDIESAIASLKESLNNIDKRINFATKTNAPTSEIDSLWEDYAKIDANIDNYNSQKETLIQTFNDKKQAIVTLVCKLISEAPVSKIEDYRAHLIGYIKDRIDSIETNKEAKEITTDTLLKERNFTEEDLTVKAISKEIKEMESAVLNKELILNEEVISKIKSLRLKKESLEHETFTYICTEKLKHSLKGISNNITKLQMELYKIMHLDTNEVKNLILESYLETKEEIKHANYIRIYRSYLANLSKVPLTLKKAYRKYLEDYNTTLESLDNPHLEDTTLKSIEETLKDKYAYIKTLESYKNRSTNSTEETKYLYTSVRSNGLFDLPFSKERWSSYFGKYFEPLLNSLDKILLKNNKYISLINVSLKSKDILKEINDYETDLKYLMNDLYNKVLSIYLKVNCYINVSIYDYRDSETLNKYISEEQDNIDKEISLVNQDITAFNSHKNEIISSMNKGYNLIDTNIKMKLNSILNGTYEEETPKEETHHFFSDTLSFIPEEKEISTDEVNTIDFNNSLDNNHKEEEPVEESSYESDIFRENPSTKENLESREEVSSDDIFADEAPLSRESVSKKRISSEEPSKEASEIFNPDDIFGIKSNNLTSEEPVISFDEEENGITRADKKAFADLLEPTKNETPKYLETISQEDNKLETENTKEVKPKRGFKVLKIEPVVSKENSKKEIKLEEKTDAAEIKERILKNDLTKKKETIFNPATSSEVVGEYNDSNAPIDLNSFLNGSLKEDNHPEEAEKTLSLSPNDNLDLMNFLNQIENNDSKAA